MSNLLLAIENSVKDVIKDYNEHERNYLSESDVTFALMSRMKDNIINPIFRIHMEARPFIKDENDLIINKHFEWTKQEHAYDGQRDDIAIIDDNFWDEVLLKAKRDQKRPNKSLKYWRLLSQPLESFKAVVEVKIKVHDNLDGINKDINKLWAIKKNNPNCIVLLVILDRCASARSLKTAKKYAKERGILVHTSK